MSRQQFLPIVWMPVKLATKLPVNIVLNTSGDTPLPVITESDNCPSMRNIAPDTSAHVYTSEPLHLCTDPQKVSGRPMYQKLSEFISLFGPCLQACLKTLLYLFSVPTAARHVLHGLLHFVCAAK